MKARVIVMLIAFVVLSSSMGCALYRVMTGQTSPTARATRPAPVAQATYSGTATPTKTPPPAPTATPTKTPTPAPTATPVPTKTPTPTPTKAAKEQRVPAAAPAQKEAPAAAPQEAQPSPTTPPPTAEAKPMVGQHGTSTLFYVLDPKPEYKNGTSFKVRVQVKNTTPSTMLFGILGVNLPTQDRQQDFISVRSGKYEEIPANGEIVSDVKVVPVRIGQVRGPATLTLSMCFSKNEACQQPGADWEVIAPPITVNLVP